MHLLRYASQMDVFVLAFAAVFIVGFVVRGVYRATMTTKCGECRSRIEKAASRCAACGATAPAG